MIFIFKKLNPYIRVCFAYSLSVWSLFALTVPDKHSIMVTPTYNV
jgi:hypothetical protein